MILRFYRAQKVEKSRKPLGGLTAADIKSIETNCSARGVTLAILLEDIEVRDSRV